LARRRHRTIALPGPNPGLTVDVDLDLTHYYARSGATDKVRQVVEQLNDIAGHRYVAPQCFAYIHAGMNEIDQAFEWQAKAYDDGSSPFNCFSPLIENLHRDPRHSAEVQRMQSRAWAANPSQ
jgi:hypothetical protein